MVAKKEYMAGFVWTTINNFLDDLDEPSPSMSYALVTYLDSNPDVSSVFRDNESLVRYQSIMTPIGPGALFSTHKLVDANRRQRIFFGFDEIWFSPDENVTEKPRSFVITRPNSIDPQEISDHGPWLNQNRCSLGLGDGEGMNYCLKVQGVARSIVRSFNDAFFARSGSTSND